MLVGSVLQLDRDLRIPWCNCCHPWSLIPRSIVLFFYHDVPTTSKIDRDMMLCKNLGSSMTLLSSTPFTFWWHIEKDYGYSRSCIIHCVEYSPAIFESATSPWHAFDEAAISCGSVSSIIDLVLSNFYSGLKPSVINMFEPFCTRWAMFFEIELVFELHKDVFSWLFCEADTIIVCSFPWLLLWLG